MTTTAIIILSALLGGSICLNLFHSAARKRLRERVTRLKDRLNALRDEEEMPFKCFIAHSRDNGHWAVYGVGPSYERRLIRVFDTDDVEYNMNEANELVENLERTLCYD